MKLNDPVTSWSCGLARSRDKLKPLNLQYHSAYVHHSPQDGEIL